LYKEIKEYKFGGKTNHGQLNKQKNPPVDSLEHLARRKERQVGEALKT
jgi:hypothetical protein